MPAVQKINYSSTINRIARQTIRIPADNAVRFSALNSVEHFVKHRTPWTFSRLFFHQLLNNIQSFGFCVGH